MLNEPFEKRYAYSTRSREDFWSEVGKAMLEWYTPFTKACQAEFSPPFEFQWFTEGLLNACYNCVDRHLPSKKNQVALIWQGDNFEESKKITYQMLFAEVNRFSALLQTMDVKRGDVVTLFMPMVPEAIYAMLACSRIGAIHSVVFGGFSGEALSKRMKDANSKFLITSNEALRGGKALSFKPLIDSALENYHGLDHILFIDKSGSMAKSYDKGIDYYSEIGQFDGARVSPQKMDSEDPLFILYTSGSTGQPKGLLHTTGGYLTYAAYTYQTLFGLKPGDIHWCTADIGWITGHSYVVYGPLCSGSTVLIYEGVPNAPSDRIWQIIEKYGVHSLYTAPTLIRALMREEHDFSQFNLSSLKILGSVGEPINPEAWRWYHEKVGKGKLPILDTWWQTETGGIMISPLPDQKEAKPGAATTPFLGIEPVILDDHGQPTPQGEEGSLCIKSPWPGQARTILNDHTRFIDTYFSQFPGHYFSGDGAKQDTDGAYWITGRIDDVINVAGHRLSTAEIESALVAHPAICEAAVVGMPDPTKGRVVAAFVILQDHHAESEALRTELIQCVQKTIGPIAKPHYLQFCRSLPKTRSGKIMRRLIQKLITGDKSHLGDTSTLLNPESLEEIMNAYQIDNAANF